MQSRPSEVLIISSLRTSPSWLTVVRPSRIAHAAVQLPTVEVVAGWVERLCGREERTQFITWLQSYRHVTINRVTACCTTRSVELVNISTNVYCISVSLQLGPTQCRPSYPQTEDLIMNTTARAWYNLKANMSRTVRYSDQGGRQQLARQLTITIQQA